MFVGDAMFVGVSGDCMVSEGLDRPRRYSGVPTGRLIMSRPREERGCPKRLGAGLHGGGGPEEEAWLVSGLLIYRGQ